jgi:hypothetical protein
MLDAAQEAITFLQTLKGETMIALNKTHQTM